MGVSLKRFVSSCFTLLFIFIWMQVGQGCGNQDVIIVVDGGIEQEDLKIDPATGIPYAPVFQIPIQGFTTSDFGFGFGAVNTNFCMTYSGDTCLAYGAHLARDTLVAKTAVGTEVVAPADGVVRVTTDERFGGYGADSAANPSYKGCALVIEHEFLSGQPVTTVLGHIQCENGAAYDPSAKTGNPGKGMTVRRGQYVAHVGKYYHGATSTIFWSHLHWGMRRGRFSTPPDDATYVAGYAPLSEFTKDSVTGALTHPTWLDPFVVLAASGDPAAVSSSGIRFHPSGSLLEDSFGNTWIVTSGSEVSSLANDTFVADRYDAHAMVRVSDEEIGCYAKASPVAPLGRVTLYKRPGTSTVVMALDDRLERYDFIRWEALLSWGFGPSDISSDLGAATYRELAYAPKGMRLLRPGTFVKADEDSEVAIVTWKQTRLPIGSADVFEALGFGWERVVSVPKSVLDAVAGPRESTVLDWDTIHRCAVPKPCPGGGTCGGGGDPDGGVTFVDSGLPDTGMLDTGTKVVEICNGFDDDGNGLVDEVFVCRLDATGGPPCTTSCGSSGQRVCEAPTCTWGSCKGYAENCSNTIDDDCNGLIDCLDPVCAPSKDCAPKPADAGVPDVVTPSGFTNVTFSYSGPASSGSIWIEGWWSWPSGSRGWGKITECVDLIPGDGKLDCTFNLPTGTSPFEFQVYLPDGRYWGDESFGSGGGKGSTVGTVALTTAKGPLTVSMKCNNPSGAPYYNGVVSSIP